MLAVALSGGVDSLASLLALKKAGFDLIACHALFHPCAKAPKGLSEICARLGIPFHILDLRCEFSAYVINYYIQAFAKGLSPNPCAICNRRMKFGALLDAVATLGASGIATGHYLRLETLPDGVKVPCAAKDSAKDQSYFLSLVAKENLQKAVFPLAELTKQEARAIIAEAGIAPPLPKESQDICFVDGNDRGKLLKKIIPPKRGRILLYEKTGTPLRQLGWHDGLWQYTAGQRRGLGIPWREPLYVRELDYASNELVVAPRAGALMAGVRTGELNIFVDPVTWPHLLYVKLRYNQKMQPAHVHFCGSQLVIRLVEPILATACGQIAACYDTAGRMLGGGIIQKILFF